MSITVIKNKYHILTCLLLTELKECFTNIRNVSRDLTEHLGFINFGCVCVCCFSFHSCLSDLNLQCICNVYASKVIFLMYSFLFYISL